MDHLQAFGLFLLGGGVLAVWGGVEGLRRKRALVRRAVAVTARVTEVVSEGGTEDGDATRYFPVVRFEAGGAAVRARLLRGTTRRHEYRAGGEIRVYYDPLDPTRVVARPHDFPGQGAAVVLGVAMGALGAALLWAGSGRPS